MTTDEFIMATVGRVQWKKYAADWQYMDCFGLVDMYYRHVLGVSVTWGDHLTDWQAQGWQEVDKPESGACAFMCWRGGIPEHAGVHIGNGRLLHCDGDGNRPGGVRVNTIDAIQKLFGEVRFYAYHPT